ncbi:ras association domain-containing protein [Dictyostelium discoideum AX4]|uniref:Ras association domain-containing protein n=1 Tax=Dictyostelium discoideum TaxID=44689 RepID=Q54Q33_DICDI|nr:ras association domain-containing protein [Dictyostelium discoideum AX4]EAL65423.1 ras association domain-containing protein [Dictyostelium discoideum AX4]|eukprot:XP_638764.1 ras association domain-containing protein [Dictyostelium discoideum AX4]
MGSTDVVIKVFFKDGSYKSLRVNEDDKTKQVCASVLTKVSLKTKNTNKLLLYTAFKENNGL